MVGGGRDDSASPVAGDESPRKLEGDESSAADADADAARDMAQEDETRFQFQGSEDESAARAVLAQSQDEGAEGLVKPHAALEPQAGALEDPSPGAAPEAAPKAFPIGISAS